MARPRILVADDDDVLRDVVSDLLKSRGYDVEAVASGPEALRIVHESALPDLVITDVAMPGFDGLELTRRLRMHHRTAHIPIVMLSGRKRMEEMLAGYTVGVDDYVAKPIDMPVLAAKVETILRRNRPGGTPEAASRGGRVIAFVHGKGGVGTTTVAVNAAVALVQAGNYPVAVLDLDLEFGNVPLMLNLVPNYTLSDVAQLVFEEVEEGEFEHAILQHETHLWVVAGADAPEKAGLVTPAAARQAIERLRDRAQYVLVDTAASFSEVNLAVLDVADLICVVGSPNLAALKGMVDYVDVLRKLSIPEDRSLLILNHTTAKALSEHHMGVVLGRVNRVPDLVIPFTAQCDDAANSGSSFLTAFPDHPVARKMSEVATRIGSIPVSAARATSDAEPQGAWATSPQL